LREREREELRKSRVYVVGDLFAKKAAQLIIRKYAVSKFFSCAKCEHALLHKIELPMSLRFNPKVNKILNGCLFFWKVAVFKLFSKKKIDIFLPTSDELNTW